MNNKLFCKNLTAGYNGKTILNNISIDIFQGEFVCLCGLNGSGKSTLLTLLSGLEAQSLKISKADIMPSIMGTDFKQTKISSFTRKECAKYISFMQQNEHSVWDFEVFDFILQGRFPYSNHGLYSKNDYNVVNSVINELSLNKLKDRTIHSLSGGEMQKVKIARSLAQNPSFLILDEPAANLDAVFEPKLLKFLKELTVLKNIGVLISIHDINIVSDLADKVCLLSKEGLITGKYNDVVNLENLKKTFGEEFQCNEKKYFQLSQ